MRESHKILEDDGIGITATCARVPVWRSHSEAVWIETERPLSSRRTRGAAGRPPPAWPWWTSRRPAASSMPSEAAGGDEVLVGRIRNDPTRQNGLALWVVADNLRKGAALNGVQIAELLAEGDLIVSPSRSAWLEAGCAGASWPAGATE